MLSGYTILSCLVLHFILREWRQFMGRTFTNGRLDNWWAE